MSLKIFGLWSKVKEADKPINQLQRSHTTVTIVHVPPKAVNSDEGVADHGEAGCADSVGSARRGQVGTGQPASKRERYSLKISVKVP